VNVEVYVEGGGAGKALKSRCRHGFSEFFRRAGLSGRMPAIVACGSRNDAYDSYCTAIAAAGQDDFPVLLVDSEAAVTQEPWNHLKTRDDWDRPVYAADEHAHLMVQCMEAWFLADRELLARFYGQGFSEGPLPGSRNVEEIPKQSVFHALGMATRQSKTKGEYGKTEHSFELLGQLDPKKVREASGHAGKLLDTLMERCGP